MAAGDGAGGDGAGGDGAGGDGAGGDGAGGDGAGGAAPADTDKACRPDAAAILAQREEMARFGSDVISRCPPPGAG